jgi:hypothetical protein
MKSLYYRIDFAEKLGLVFTHMSFNFTNMYNVNNFKNSEDHENIQLPSDAILNDAVYLKYFVLNISL